MSAQQDIPGKLFDEWPDRYDAWFETPIGALVKKYESALLIDLLQPESGELILDVGCGTGVFTCDILARGTHAIGLDISSPMLRQSAQKAKGYSFQAVAGDMISLPFGRECFDRVFSMTALEFVEDGQAAVRELLRVAKKGGTVVVTTLNSLSPWAVRRKQKAQQGHRLFQNMIFRSPDELRALGGSTAEVKTAIHFQKDENPIRACEIEMEGKKGNLNTGAFLAARWVKPSN
jgi:ubiquinone/menaquinone biosynthesis C-methylase UbiE